MAKSDSPVAPPNSKLEAVIENESLYRIIRKINQAHGSANPEIGYSLVLAVFDSLYEDDLTEIEGKTYPTQMLRFWDYIAGYQGLGQGYQNHLENEKKKALKVKFPELGGPLTQILGYILTEIQPEERDQMMRKIGLEVYSAISKISRQPYETGMLNERLVALENAIVLTIHETADKMGKPERLDLKV
ncbi:hypothetical protein ACFL2V_10965 [Pseudomonadota bacterium]